MGPRVRGQGACLYTLRRTIRPHTSALMIPTAAVHRSIVSQIQMNIFLMFESILIVVGRSLLFIVGPPDVVHMATLVSGAQELIQRSTIARVDDFLRVHLFKAPMDAQTRFAQIKVWTQDICSSQMIELATIPVLGVLGPSLCRHAATFSILGSTAETLTQDKMVVLVFSALLVGFRSHPFTSALHLDPSTLPTSPVTPCPTARFPATQTEVVVDVGSLFVERRQGILLESWWATIRSVMVMQRSTSEHLKRTANPLTGRALNTRTPPCPAPSQREQAHGHSVLHHGRDGVGHLRADRV